MKIKDFIKIYDKTPMGGRRMLINSHVVTKYVPFHQKENICRSIISTTSYKDGIDGKRIYSPNTVSEYMLYIMCLIGEYTDLEFCDDGENSDDMAKTRIDEFELLDESGALDMLLGINGDGAEGIPINELNRFNSILQWVKDETIAKEESLVRFFETKFESSGLVLEAFLSGIQKSMDGLLGSEAVKAQILDFEKRKEAEDEQ